MYTYANLEPNLFILAYLLLVQMPQIKHPVYHNHGKVHGEVCVKTIHFELLFAV